MGTRAMRYLWAERQHQHLSAQQQHRWTQCQPCTCQPSSNTLELDVSHAADVMFPEAHAIRERNIVNKMYGTANRSRHVLQGQFGAAHQRILQA